jgi:hypothetical protein
LLKIILHAALKCDVSAAIGNMRSEEQIMTRGVMQKFRSWCPELYRRTTRKKTSYNLKNHIKKCAYNIVN